MVGGFSHWPVNLGLGVSGGPGWEAPGWVLGCTISHSGKCDGVREARVEWHLKIKHSACIQLGGWCRVNLKQLPDGLERWDQVQRGKDTCLG